MTRNASRQRLDQQSIVVSIGWFEMVYFNNALKNYCFVEKQPTLRNFIIFGA